MSDQTLNKSIYIKGLLLSHSFLKNLTTYICLDGNVCIYGKNATGKSSVLNLIPVFFGENPNNIVETSGDKKSFCDYYLPNENSYIIFDYVKNGENYCSLIYKTIIKSGNSVLDHRKKVNYYLFKTSAKEIQAQREKLDLNNKKLLGWLDELKKYYVSYHCADTATYREIILHQPSLNGRNYERAKYSDIFSFSNKEKISNLEKLESLFTNPNLSQHPISFLKKTVIDSYITPEKFLPEEIRPSTSNKTVFDTITNLKKDYFNLKQLEENKEKFLNLAESYNDFISIYKYLNNARDYSKKITIEIDQNLKTEEEKFNTEKNTLTKKRNDVITEIGVKKQNNKNNEKHIKDNESTLKTIEEKYNDYIKQNIDDLIEEEKLEQDLNSDKSTLDAELTLLKKTQSASDALINEEKQKAKKIIQDNYNSSFKLAKQALNKIKDEISNHQKESLKQETKIKDSYNLLIKDCNEAYNLEDKKNQTDLKNINTELKNLSIEKIAPELSLQLEELKGHKIIDEENYENALKNKGLTEKQKNKLDQEIIEKDRESRELFSKKINKETELQKLEEKIKALSDSLFEYLNQYIPDWKNTIGKVINPELLPLSFNNISQSADNSSFYGLKLNLSQLKIPDFKLSKEDLETRIDILRKDIISDEEKLKLLAKENNIRKTESEALESKLKKLEAEIEIYKINKKKDEEEIQKLHKKIENRLQEESKKLSSKLTILTEEKGKKFNLKNEAISNLETKRDNELSILKTKTDGEELTLIADRTEAETKISDLTENYNQKIKNLNQEFEKKYSQKELQKKITDLENKIGEIDKRLDNINLNRGKVKEYSIFDASSKITIKRLNQENTNYKEIITNNELTIKSLENEKISLETETSTLTTSYEKLKNKLDKEKKSWVDFRSDFKLDIPVFNELFDIEKFSITEVNAKYHHYKNLKKQVIVSKKDVTDIVSIIKESSIAADWELLYDFSAYIDDDSFIASIFDFQKAIKELYSSLMPSDRRNWIENFISYYSYVSSFGDAIKKIKNKTTSLTREISETIKTNNLDLFENLSDIKIEFNIHLYSETDLSTYIENFENNFQTYRLETAGDNDCLPAKELVELLEVIIQEIDRFDWLKDFSKILNVKITFKENNRPVDIKSDLDLFHCSSGGLSRLAVLIIFSALGKYICKDNQIRPPLCIDETGMFDSKNYLKMVRLAEKINFNMVSVAPNPSPERLQTADYHYMIIPALGFKLMNNSPIKEAVNE